MNPNLAICIGCRESRGARTDAGKVACGLDPQRRGLEVISAAHECPLGKFPARGLGDSVKSALDATGVGPLAKRLIEKVRGRPCNCAGRQAALNRVFPRRG